VPPFESQKGERDDKAELRIVAKRCELQSDSRRFYTLKCTRQQKNTNNEHSQNYAIAHLNTLALVCNFTIKGVVTIADFCDRDERSCPTQSNSDCLISARSRFGHRRDDRATGGRTVRDRLRLSSPTSHSRRAQSRIDESVRSPISDDDLPF
jgi:hypothetical protein